MQVKSSWDYNKEQNKWILIFLNEVIFAQKMVPLLKQQKFSFDINDIQESQNVLIVTVHKQQCSNTYIQVISQTSHV
jgi:nucleoside-triphosphatase THEP1